MYYSGMSYICSHWHGKLSLRVSLWVNMISLIAVISYAELYFLTRLASSTEHLVAFTLGSLLITRLIIYPWQLIGLFRAIEYDFLEHRNILKSRSLQALSLLTVLFTMVYSIGTLQGTFSYLKQLERYSKKPEAANYQLMINNDNKSLLISGNLDIGITDAVRAKLKSYPGIKSAVLSSGGGHIYEGRGLAKVFTKFKLDTYVEEECSSACTTAFMGGVNRYLAAEGKLGFHQYKVETKNHGKIVPFYDLRIEQQRDLELFKSRGVKQQFLDRMYEQPAHSIWFPKHSTLRESLIINKQDVAQEP